MKMWESLLECPISSNAAVQRSSSKVVCSGHIKKTGQPCNAAASANGFCGRHGGVKTSPSSSPRASPKVKNQCQALTSKKEPCKKGAAPGCNFCAAHKEKQTIVVEAQVEEPVIEEVKVFDFVFDKDDIINASLYKCLDETQEQYVHIQTSMCIQKMIDEWYVIGYFNADSDDIEDYDENIHPKIVGIELV